LIRSGEFRTGITIETKGTDIASSEFEDSICSSHKKTDHNSIYHKSLEKHLAIKFKWLNII